MFAEGSKGGRQASWKEGTIHIPHTRAFPQFLENAASAGDTS